MEQGNLTFGDTLTVEQFKSKFMVSRIDVKKNPKTGKLFFSYGAKTGAVAIKGIPQHPMISIVCPKGDTIDMEHIGMQGCTTFALLHEEGQGGAPVLASF